MRGPTFDMGRDVGAHVFRIVGVDASEPALRVFVDGYGVTAQHGAPALRVVNPVGPQVPVPKTVVGTARGDGVAFFAFAQRRLGPAGAEHVVDVMAQQRGVDRLGDEIARAGFVGLLDRVQVIQTGDHQDRCLARGGQGAQRRTGFETVHSRHDDIEQNDVRTDRLAHADRRRPAAGFLDVEVARNQGGFGQKPAHRLIVDDEYQWSGEFLIRFHRDSSPVAVVDAVYPASAWAPCARRDGLATGRIGCDDLPRGPVRSAPARPPQAGNSARATGLGRL